MARLHLFELMDQSWFPDFLRDYMTDYLEFVTDKFDMYQNIHPVLERGLAATDTRAIIDTGSGGGGGMVKISQRFQAVGKPVDITLTDFYPNEKGFEKVSALDEYITYSKESVDAKNIPKQLKGLRTMFLAFHHFRPKDGAQIIKNAVDNGEPIAIFEIYQLTVKDIISPIFAPIFVLLLTPLIRPFRLGRIIFTYLIPILPLVVMFDGLVSVLRSYSPKELKTLIAEADPNDTFDWEIDGIPTGGITVHYLLGTPKK
jgi:hypothetical protein